MNTVQVVLPAELLEAAGVDPANPSADAAMLLALELYRQHRVSLGRAAELCQASVEQFMLFAGRNEVPMHYGIANLEEDRNTLDRLS